MAGWRILPRRKVGGAGALEYGAMTGFIAAAIIATAMTLGGYLNLTEPIEGEIVAFGAHEICWDAFGFNAERQPVPCELQLSWLVGEFYRAEKWAAQAPWNTAR